MSMNVEVPVPELFVTTEAPGTTKAPKEEEVMSMPEVFAETTKSPKEEEEMSMPEVFAETTKAPKEEEEMSMPEVFAETTAPPGKEEEMSMPEAFDLTTAAPGTPATESIETVSTAVPSAMSMSMPDVEIDETWDADASDEAEGEPEEITGDDKFAGIKDAVSSGTDSSG
jgi:hypothetical protein